MVRSTSLVLLALTVLGCHHSNPGEAPAPADEPKADVTLLVQNHHWLDINIYMMLGNVKQRLGTVTGSSSKHFSIPWSKLGSQSGLQLIADPVGQAQGITTEIIVVRPGAEVVWTIESALRSSNIAVY